MKDELLESRISSQVTAGKSASKSKATLSAFEKSFQEHWKHYTTCKPAYVMEDCSEYKGKLGTVAAQQNTATAKTTVVKDTEPPPKPLAKPTKACQKTSSCTSANHTYGTFWPTRKQPESHRGGSVTYAASSGELPPPSAGEFAIASPAFAENELIPGEYTCAGAGISPPLEWKNLPAKTAALVLFIIDDDSSNKEGGIRWIVANINPNSKGVAAGQTPEEGVVGTNTAGKAAYSPICPTKGKTDTIEFTMYALSKKLNVSSGFQPSQAEAEYGQGKLILGSQAAITYGLASG